VTAATAAAAAGADSTGGVYSPMASPRAWRDNSGAAGPAVPAAAAAAVKTTGYGVMLAAGWFVKRRKGLVNIPMWRRRYLVLTTTGHLLYFKTETAQRHRGSVDLRHAFDLFHGSECDRLTDWPHDRPVGCRLQLEAEDRTMYLVSESLADGGRWHTLLRLLQRFATNQYVHDILHPEGGAIAKHLEGLTPCASSSFLRLNLLASVDRNDRCFDCHLRGTAWACCSLGVFLCMRCAGLHRKLGLSHEGFLCDVRSLELGEFSESELLGLELCGGNARGEAVLECKLPPEFRRPAESNDRMLAFIKEKYVDGTFSEGGATAMGGPISLGVDAISTFSISDDGGNESLSDDDDIVVVPKP